MVEGGGEELAPQTPPYSKVTHHPTLGNGENEWLTCRLVTASVSVPVESLFHDSCKEL